MANVDTFAALSAEEMQRLLEEQKRKQAISKASFSSDYHTPLNRNIEQEGVIQARQRFTPQPTPAPTPRKIYPSFTPEGYSVDGDVDISHTSPTDPGMPKQPYYNRGNFVTPDGTSLGDAKTFDPEEWEDPFLTTHTDRGDLESQAQDHYYHKSYQPAEFLQGMQPSVSQQGEEQTAYETAEAQRNLLQRDLGRYAVRRDDKGIAQIDKVPMSVDEANRMSGPEIGSLPGVTKSEVIKNAAVESVRQWGQAARGIDMRDDDDIIQEAKDLRAFQQARIDGTEDEDYIRGELAGLSTAAKRERAKELNDIRQKTLRLQGEGDIEAYIAKMIGTESRLREEYMASEDLMQISRNLLQNRMISEEKAFALDALASAGAQVPIYAVAAITRLPLINALRPYSSTLSYAGFGALAGGMERGVAETEKLRAGSEFAQVAETLAAEAIGEILPIQYLAMSGKKLNPTSRMMGRPRTKGQFIAAIGKRVFAVLGLSATAEGSGEGLTAVAELYTGLDADKREIVDQAFKAGGFEGMAKAIIDLQADGLNTGVVVSKHKIGEAVALGAVSGPGLASLVLPGEVGNIISEQAIDKRISRRELHGNIEAIIAGDEVTPDFAAKLESLKKQVDSEIKSLAPAVNVGVHKGVRQGTGLEGEGSIIEGAFSGRDETDTTKKDRVDIHLTGILDALQSFDGSVNLNSTKDIRNATRRVIRHELGHEGLNRLPNLTRVIYRDNIVAIKEWLANSPYADQFKNIDKNDMQQRQAAEEWVNSLSENDFKKHKNLALRIKNAAVKAFGKEASAETSIRKLADDIAMLPLEMRKGGTKRLSEIRKLEQAATVRMKKEKLDEAAAARAADALAEVETDAGKVVPITRETATETIPELPDIKVAASKKPTGGTVVPIVKGEDPRSLLIETATKKATAPNLHIRNSDSRMNSIKEDWENNKDDLDFRRDYDNFEAYEEAEWTLNYDMWIDEIQAEEFSEAAGEVESTVTPIDSARTEEKAPVPIELVGKSATERQEKKVKDEVAGELDSVEASVDNILSTFDSDATATDAIANNTMDQLVRMEAQRSPHTREELWAALNYRVETGAKLDVVFSKKSRKVQTPEEKLTGDVNDRSAKVFRPGIENLDIAADEKQVRRDLHKRLQNLFGAPARKRGVKAGTLETYREQAKHILSGNLDAVNEFIAKLEPQITGKVEKQRKSDTRRDQRAKRLNKTDAEVMKYRPQGTTHPMESKMSYPFARSEIDALEKAGTITTEEAEIRLQGINRIRKVFAGKAGQTVKRILSEMTYGIGNYEDIVPWSEVYTETEVAEKGERAEIGAAQARIERYDPTSLTTKEKIKLLKEVETNEEKSLLDEAEANPPYPDVDKFDSNQDPVFNALQQTMLALKTRRERLAFLRAPTDFKSPAEQAEFKAWQKDKKGFKQAEYKAEQKAKTDAQMAKAEKAGKVTRIPSEAGEFTAADARRMWKERAGITNYDPTWFDTLKDDNIDEETVTIAGQEYTANGEVVDLDSMSVDDDTVFSKVIREPRTTDNMGITQYLPGTVEYEGQEGDAFIIKIGSKDTDNIYAVAIANKIIQFTPDEFKKLFNPKATKAKQDIKLKHWKGFVRRMIGKESLTGFNVKAKRWVLIAWARDVGTNPPDSIKRQEYQNAWGKEVLGESKLVNAVTDLNLTTVASYWSREHGLEMNVFMTPEKVAVSKGDPKLEAVFEEVFDDKNGTAMPQFLNAYKKGLTDVAGMNDKKVNEEVNKLIGQGLLNESARDQSSGDKRLAIFDARDGVVNKWYSMLAGQLEIIDDEIVASDFLEAHHAALVEFMNGVGAEVFPDQTVPKFDVTKSTSVTSITGPGSRLELTDAWYGVENNEVSLQRRLDYVDALFNAPGRNSRAVRSQIEIVNDAIKTVNEATTFSKTLRGDKKGYTEHFNDSFWYKITSYLYGKPVQAIRDVNKNTRFGTTKGTITAADEIADLVQRHMSSTQRAEGLETGNDLVQDVSLRTGQFYSALSKIFAAATNRKGVIEPAENAEIIAFLAGKDVDFSSPDVAQAAKELKSLMGDVYAYAQEETKGLKKPLDLRGAGDTMIPRVWNIEWLATRDGKAKFLREISAHFSPPGSTTPIFAEADITVDDLYDVVINSGGFVQGEWTNLKADQTRSEKDVQKDLKVQGYLDALGTEALIDGGLVLDDLQAIIPRFVQKAVERVEYAKRFGTNDEILRDMIKKGLEQIRAHNRDALKLKDGDPMPYIDEKRFERSVWDMSRILRNKYGYDMANMPTRIWMQRLTNAATIAKLPLVALASMPEFFTPLLKGDVSPQHWVVDLMAGMAWAGYKGMNGMSKLLLNRHLPAMRKYSSEINGLGIISDVQLLRELGIADIQAMGDLVSTRYANPNFARGGLRAGAKGTLAAKIPKGVRAVFNMQTYMQATMLTTMTEMQQLMALRNFQRHVSTRLKFISANKGKTLTGRQANKLKQYKQDLLDYGLTGDVDLDTSHGEAEFNAGALRFIDQVITRPNDATTAKAFKNPLVAPLVLFKRFITTFGNTLLTSVGNDFAHKVDNVERAKQVGKVMTTAVAMYGAVMFSEIIRGAIRGDLDDDDFTFTGGDFNQFIRRLDRTGLLSAPGALAVNLAFPYKRGWWDSTESRIMGELTGPLGGDATALGDTLLKNDAAAWHRFMSQLVPTLKNVVPKPESKKKRKKKGAAGGLY